MTTGTAISEATAAIDRLAASELPFRASSDRGSRFIGGSLTHRESGANAFLVVIAVFAAIVLRVVVRVVLEVHTVQNCADELRPSLFDLLDRSASRVTAR